MNSSEFQNILGYRFNDEMLLFRALTHRSYLNEKNDCTVKNNERLEFLGDAFFDAVISEELYKRLEDVEEGILTKIRALIVCEKSLVFHGRQIGIGKHIFLGKGEESTGGRDRNALVADAVEAVIGAVYLDGGYDAAKNVILRIFKTWIDDAVSGRLNNDYKTALQEMLQAKGENRIAYCLDREEGPDHDKTFYINLFCAGELIGAGQGRSKKEAEQNAAKEALERGVHICTLKE